MNRLGNSLIWSATAGWSECNTEALVEEALSDLSCVFTTARVRKGTLLLEDLHYDRISTWYSDVSGTQVSRNTWAEGIGLMTRLPPMDACRILVLKCRNGDISLALCPREIPQNIEVRHLGMHAHVTFAIRKEDPTKKWLDRRELNETAVNCGGELFASPCETIMVNEEQEILEGIYSNVLVKCADEWMTPCPEVYPILNGVAIQSLRATAQIEGINIASRSITVSDLLDAEAVWLTNGLIGAVPVTAIATPHHRVSKEIHTPKWLTAWKAPWVSR